MFHSGQMWLIPATCLCEEGPEGCYEPPLTGWKGWMLVGATPVMFHGGAKVGLVVKEERMRF